MPSSLAESVNNFEFNCLSSCKPVALLAISLCMHELVHAKKSLSKKCCGCGSQHPCCAAHLKQLELSLHRTAPISRRASVCRRFFAARVQMAEVTQPFLVASASPPLKHAWSAMLSISVHKVQNRSKREWSSRAPCIGQQDSVGHRQEPW